MLDAEDHEHIWEVSKVLKAVTCESDGELEYTCACGETKTEVVKASEEYHDYYFLETIEDSKMDLYKCRICGALKTMAVVEDKCDHEGATIVDTDSAKPCTIPGTRIINCPKCGEIVEKLPLKDHEAAEGAKGYILKDAVECESDGLEEVKCKWCDKEFERVISAHNFVETSRKEATCEEYEEITYTCSVCREATKVEVGTELADHNYVVKSTVPATCTRAGYTNKVCTACGTIKQDPIKATGHSKYTLDAQNKPTTTPVDDFKYIYVNANGKAIKDDNGDILKVENYTEGMRDCEYDIAESYTCPLCNQPIINVVAKTYGNHIVKGERVVGILGYDPITKEIEVKRDANTDEIVFVEDGVVDCTHAEVEVFTCGNPDCRETDHEVIRVTKSTSHEPSTGRKTYHAETCEDDAYYSYSCKWCKEPIIEPATKKATGHKFFVQDATCTEPAKLACKNPKCAGLTDKTSAAQTAWLEANAEEAAKLDNKKPKGHNFDGNISTVVKTNTTTKALEAYILCKANGCDNNKNSKGILVTVEAENPVAKNGDAVTVTYTLEGYTYTYTAVVSNFKSATNYTVTVSGAATVTAVAEVGSGDGS